MQRQSISQAHKINAQSVSQQLLLWDSPSSSPASNPLHLHTPIFIAEHDIL